MLTPVKYLYYFKFSVKRIKVSRNNRKDRSVRERNETNHIIEMLVPFDAFQTKASLNSKEPVSIFE
jgi:hypothetical protein